MFLTAILLFFAANILAQNKEKITFTVNATGMAKLLADNINITLNLGVENKDPQRAYEEHKLRESKILSLIKKYGIADKDISYSLFKISKYRDYRDKKVSFKTNQSLQFILKDFANYTELQLDLLQNGFYEFSSNFSTTKRKEGHEKSVKDALQNTESEAQLYAKNLNMKVSKIVSIETNNPIIYPRSDLMFKAELAPSGGLVDIPQYITITTNVKVVYTLVE